MNEEEKRLEILKAEAAIRELASRMMQANENAVLADEARKRLELAIKSLDDSKTEFQALVDSQKKVLEEESEKLNQARNLLSQTAKNIESSGENTKKEMVLALNEANASLLKECENLDKAKQQMRETAESLKATIKAVEEYPQKFYEMLGKKLEESEKRSDIKSKSLQQGIDANSNHLIKMGDRIEKTIGAMLSVKQNIDDFSKELQGISSPIGTLDERLLSLKRLNEEFYGKLSESLTKEISKEREGVYAKFEAMEGEINANSKGIKELEKQINKSNEKLQSFEHVLEEKTSILFYLLRFAIIFAALSVGVGITTILLLKNII